MTPKEYQPIAKRMLEKLYSEVEQVKKEWASIKGNKNIYSPRVDLAVGPFAIDKRYEKKYDGLMRMRKSQAFIKSMIAKHNENLKTIDKNLITFGLKSEDDYFQKLLYFNRNARCLLCIEIENKVNRKHLIGGLVNASALGRVAILIPWTPEKLKAFIRIRNYLKFLGRVEKNTFKTDNVLILTKNQFDGCLRQIISK